MEEICVIREGDEGESVKKLQSFLFRYGYYSLQKKTEKWKEIWGKFERLTREALISYQIFHGLSPSGELDATTSAIMKLPRCARPDSSRRRNADPCVRAFSYGISQYTPDLTNAVVDKAVKQGLDIWRRHGFTFTGKTRSTYHIDMKFVTGPHHNSSFATNEVGHGYAIGGSWGGDVCFNDLFQWDILLAPQAGIRDLVTVVAHEVGHVIGLTHKGMGPGALMFPTVEFSRALTNADEAALQAWSARCRPVRGVI